MNRAAIGMALGSAALFGASTPLAKLLLGTLGPWTLAGLLYLGAGVGLGLMRLGGRLRGRVAGEAALGRADLGRLGLVILAGGVAGPGLLMAGLARTDAGSASLLLNLEAVATLAIAWLVYRENVDGRLMLGAGAILAGAAVLSWQGGAGLDAGALLVALACVAWGIDNNLTRGLSAADPVTIAAAKGLGAGTVNLGLASLAGEAVPALPAAAGAAALGLVGYGASLVLFVRALRDLGTARTGAYFALAPFVGAVLAVALLGEPVTVPLALAGALMAAGLWLHLTERHDHLHAHDPMEHAHRHSHDAHHRHAHGPGDPTGEPHSHPHRHGSLSHRHPHYPDLHHRHGHGHGKGHTQGPADGAAAPQPAADRASAS
jgi:drug/metabolite transporter (DMT)-like permease